MLILAGMTAFLTGVSRSPFTSAILVLEMTDRHSVIFQLMYAASIGYVIAMAIDRKSYYERMKERLIARVMPPEPVTSTRSQRQRERFAPTQREEDGEDSDLGLG